MQLIILLDTLADFTAAATLDDFRAMFGSQAPHLWARFCEYEYDLLRWYARLDPGHRAAFAAAINAHLLANGSPAAQPMTVTHRRRVTYVLREPVCGECGHALVSAPGSGAPVCGECAEPWPG
jgi:hypothetical protein